MGELDLEALLLDIVNVQKEYKRLVKSRKISKKALRDLAIPFRDKYGLFDLETLTIIRDQMSLERFYRFYQEIKNKGEVVYEEFYDSEEVKEERKFQKE